MVVGQENPAGGGQSSANSVFSVAHENSSSGRRIYGVQFQGTASEYFRIWIVNFFLSIITLGIYSAWAKVRRQRYFYGNTFLDGHNFEYHARPKQILIGRLIAVAVILVLNILASLHPALGLVPIVFIFLFPWFVNRSLRFNARVTSYRNVHFDFAHKSYWWALFVFGIMPIISMTSLFLLSPVSQRLRAEYAINGLRYGELKFETDPPLGRLYSNFFLTLLLGVIGFVAFVGLMIGIFAIFSTIFHISFEYMDIKNMDWSKDGAFELVFLILSNFLIIALMFVALSFSYGFHRAGVRNIVFDATSAEKKFFLHSGLQRATYGWIVMSNLIATLCSLGLLHAWSVVRLWQYTMGKTAMTTSEPLEVLAGKQQQAGDAFAAEYMDLDGFDFGF